MPGRNQPTSLRPRTTCRTARDVLYKLWYNANNRGVIAAERQEISDCDLSASRSVDRSVNPKLSQFSMHRKRPEQRRERKKKEINLIREEIGE